MADNRMNKAARSNLMGRLRSNMGQQKQQTGSSGKSMFRGNADGTQTDHMSDEDMGRAPVRPAPSQKRRPEADGPSRKQMFRGNDDGTQVGHMSDEDMGRAPVRSQGGGFDSDAFLRSMDRVGTAQGTREAQAAQSPADPDPENEADLPNFADNSQGASQRRRLGMRSRLARR
jgi:hypothetical protein